MPRPAPAPWRRGFDLWCADPVAGSVLTAVRLSEGVSADRLRAEILVRCNLSLANGLGPLADKVFRIGHLGDFGDSSVMGTLAAVEMSLRALGIPFDPGGLGTALASLAGNTPFFTDSR